MERLFVMRVYRKVRVATARLMLSRTRETVSGQLVFLRIRPRGPLGSQGQRVRLYIAREIVNSDGCYLAKRCGDST
jgi:hypothetical protein